MKICSYSPQFKNIIPFILEDDSKSFFEKIPKNFFGQIDKKPFLNFCIESNAIKIIKKILINPELTKTINTNKETFFLLISNKKLKASEKTYIYTKIKKNNFKINEKIVFRLICKYDKRLLFWLNKSKFLEKKDYENLFFGEITEFELDFCRKKNLNLVNLLLKSHKKQIIEFENYQNLLKEKELIIFINKGLKNFLKNKDINLLDSVIKILTNNLYLIDKIEKNLLEKIHVDSIEMFNFLNMDIQKILLYKKFSHKKNKETIKKI
jgi:hypothetical protein